MSLSEYNENEEEKVEGKFSVGIFRKLVQLIRPYWGKLLLMAVLMIIMALCDVSYDLLNEFAIDKVITPEAHDKLWIVGLVYGILAVLEGVGVFLFIFMAGRIESAMAYDIRAKGFVKLQELSFSYYDKTKVGYIIARMMSDTSRLCEMISWGLVDFSWGIATMVMVVVVMFIRHWKLALLVMTVMPPMIVGTYFLRKKILEVYRDVRRTNSLITGKYSEGISGANTAKTLLTEEKTIDEFEYETGKMKRQSIKAAVWSAYMWPLVTVLGSIGMAIALTAGGKQVIFHGLSLGTMTMFFTLASKFFAPVTSITNILAEYQRAQASAERLIQLLETEPDVIDSPEIIEKYGDAFHPKFENWEDTYGEISFEDVSFHYIEGEEVLKHFSLKIEKGQTIALVGETGSGKSTIANLACRFYEPTSGRILVDGTDYRERSQVWLQSKLGYVLQTPHLFSGTIRDNIAYGKLDATDEEIARAAKLVEADKFITEFENGYDTQVGEEGANLSMGQRQLISFARAIIADPKILVLDEATSSVDTETEYMIQHAVDKVLEGRTSIVVAHRLSTVRNADRILVINNGEVVEDGSHKVLMAKKGIYYRLYTNQFIEESSAAALN